VEAAVQGVGEAGGGESKGSGGMQLLAEIIEASGYAVGAESGMQLLPGSL
jgi:hypothetical protein